MAQDAIKVSEIIADFLAEKNIKHVFGIIGAGNAHIFDAILRKNYTEIICVHHEQTACMAMQTYFRTSGKISAAIVTTGAGSTNAVTGVVSAWMDSIPGLVISGNENSKFIHDKNPLRIWGVQGYDSVDMVKKVTKYSSRVMEPGHISHELEKAYHTALSGKPGPCWIDIPMNVQSASISVSAFSTLEKYQPDQVKNVSSETKQSAEIIFNEIKNAKRPVIWLGHGIRLSNGVQLIKPLLEKLQCPALVSWAGIDMIESDYPLIFGRAGVYGQRAANFVLQNCDFLLTIGTRLAIPQIGYDLSEFARAAKIAVVEIDQDELEKHQSRVTIPVLSDAKYFMEMLLEVSHQLKHQEWINHCKKFQQKYPVLGPEHEDKNNFINTYKFMNKLSEYLKPNQIIVTDMGTALLSGHQALMLKEGQRLMTSTGLGEMGYGLPGAIGASFAANKAEVMCLNCDGGMMMNLQELQTIVHHQLPIKIIIFNNDGYLMIKHTQKALFSGRYIGTDTKSGVTCPNYQKIAKAFDIPSFDIKTWEDFDEIMPQVQSHPGPVICEVYMDPEQLFLPKLSLAPQKDGSIVSPPLEDLSPLLPREELKENMIIGLHPKSEGLIQ
jgi:acetolactate synthase-1/2/3 large subunit